MCVDCYRYCAGSVPLVLVDPLSHGLVIVIVFRSIAILVLTYETYCCYCCSCHDFGVVMVVIDIVIGFCFGHWCCNWYCYCCCSSVVFVMDIVVY